MNNTTVNIDHLTNADPKGVSRVCWEIIQKLQDCSRSEQLLAIAIVYRALQLSADLNAQDLYTWAANVVNRDETASRTFAGLCDYLQGELTIEQD